MPKRNVSTSIPIQGMPLLLYTFMEPFIKKGGYKQKAKRRLKTKNISAVRSSLEAFPSGSNPL